MKLIDELEKEMEKAKTSHFNVGDTVDVHVKILEGDKERIQVFNGIVIARNGGGLKETFTVRRIVQGEGVERIFPIHSPRVASIVVKRQGKAQRAKLYYLRERTGKSVKVKARLGIVPGEETLVPEMPVIEAKAPEAPATPTAPAEKPASPKAQ